VLLHFSSFLIRPERFRLIVHHDGILSKNCEREKHLFGASTATSEVQFQCSS
nr:hypothetical protein [Tanacetum cinerariifolium]